MDAKTTFVVTISADAEWQVVKKYFSNPLMNKSTYGQWFTKNYKLLPLTEESVVFFHGGWGKVSAAASTQYLIDYWHPEMIVNLGTCGGFEGDINMGEIILANKTIIYDIYEQMGDPDEHVRYYATTIDNS